MSTTYELISIAEQANNLASVMLQLKGQTNESIDIGARKQFVAVGMKAAELSLKALSSAEAIASTITLPKE